MHVHSLTLAAFAHARSGDKGNHANIGVLAYTKAGFLWMQKYLTAEIVHSYFVNLKPSRVVRYEAPNVLGLNFVLYDVLAGGASRSLRVDSQGKTLGLALLQMEIRLDNTRWDISDWEAMLRHRPKSEGNKDKKSSNAVQDTFEVLGLLFGRKWRKSNG
jgi:hypothetical protein